MGLSAKERRELYKKEMADRHKESADSKGDSGRYRDIYDPRKKSGVSFWKCTEDDHDIYMVPFVTGKQHPTKKEGHTGINVMPFIHRGIGVNEDSYICLNRTYNERCPVCEYQKELRESSEEDIDEKVLKALSPTRRVIYNIVCLDSPKETEKGVQVFDVSHWLFTEPLDELAEKKKGGGKVLYADDTIGKIISFRRKGTKINTEFTAFEFKDREPISDDILESAYCLDELLHKPTYQEVYNAFFASVKKGSEEAPAEEEGTSDEGSANSGQEQQPEPETSRKKLLTKKTEEVDVPVSVTKFDDCPNGAAFGTDFNQYEECRPCPARDDCKAKKDELDTLKSPAPPERKKLTRRDK